ncbi:unnamed protein product [Schistosoma spindalis]|nr:unnamed protein product [Schistosoma spindale]
MKLFIIMNILSVVYSAQILSNRSPYIDKSGYQQSSNQLNGILKTKVDVVINDALLGDREKNQLIKWNPSYGNSQSEIYKHLSSSICYLVMFIFIIYHV